MSNPDRRLVDGLRLAVVAAVVAVVTWVVLSIVHSQWILWSVAVGGMVLCIVAAIRVSHRGDASGERAVAYVTAGVVLWTVMMMGAGVVAVLLTWSFPSPG